jgi:zinc protease
MAIALATLPYSGNIHRTVFPNGLTLLAYHNPNVRSVNISGALLAGNVYEQAHERMVASLVGSMLMRGTQHRDFDTLYGQLEDVGGDLGMGAGVFRLGFHGKALAEDLPLLLDLLSDALRHPAFPEEHLNLIKKQRATEIKYSEQDTRFRANRGFRDALYPKGHPFHNPLEGMLESIQAVTPQMLRDFHGRVYGAQGMTLVVVGNCDPLLVEAEARRTFGDWETTQPPKPSVPTLTKPSTSLEKHTFIAGKTQSDIVMGTLGPSRFSLDYIPASITNSILGEFGMMGRLGHSIREEGGLAYYANSSLEGGDAQGAWSISAGVADKNIALTIQKAKDEVRRITEELVSESDLADNQSYYTGRQPLRLESSGGIANMLETIERYHLGLDYLLHYNEMIYSITREQVQQVAAKYLNADALVVSVAGANGG